VNLEDKIRKYIIPMLKKARGHNPRPRPRERDKVSEPSSARASVKKKFRRTR